MSLFERAYSFERRAEAEAEVICVLEKGETGTVMACLSFSRQIVLPLSKGASRRKGHGFPSRAADPGH